MSGSRTLSVITPVRNMARFIGETLDSVAALQTDHEHLVFDADSDDGTTEVLASRDDPDLTWASKPDRGQTHAVNMGLETARGRLIGWLNGDDAYVSEAVDRAIEHLLSSPETMAIYGGIELIEEDGEHIRTHIPANFNWHRYLYFNYNYPTPTFIFKRELLSQAPSMNEEFADAADYDFYLRLFKGRRIDRRPEPLVRFRYHDESKSTADVWTQIDEALEIRLRWARNPLDRLIMSGSERARRAILPRISNWPHPEPSPLVKGSQRVSRWRGRRNA
jgi:glycosyltransferase involved in cell wall biosynthesis